MKNLTFTLASLIGIALFSVQAAAQEPVNGAKIEFKKDVHDYGEVAYGGDGITSFEFKNTGSAPLIISEAKKTCGCTVPDYPKEPIPPGGTGVIKVKYDTKRPGVINKTVTIVSNAVNEPNYLIHIKGQVLPQPESGVPVNANGPR